MNDTRGHDVLASGTTRGHVSTTRSHVSGTTRSHVSGTTRSHVSGTTRSHDNIIIKEEF